MYILMVTNLTAISLKGNNNKGNNNKGNIMRSTLYAPTNLKATLAALRKNPKLGSRKIIASERWADFFKKSYSYAVTEN